MKMKKIMDPMKISEAVIALISELAKASERICRTASPSSAPKARLKRNLITLLKMQSLQHRLARTRIMAAMNPISEIPRPVRIPNPHTYVFVRSDCWEGLECGS
jgi:hypothetical protein